jgi:hypothetical protein
VTWRDWRINASVRPAVAATAGISNRNCRAAGFDSWRRLRLDQARAQARPPKLTKVRSRWLWVPLRCSWPSSQRGGDRIRAWYLPTAGANRQTPVVVKFTGGGRAAPDLGRASRPAVHAYVERQLRHFRDLALGAIGALTASEAAPARSESRRATRDTTHRSGLMFLGDWQRRPCHRKEPAIPPQCAMFRAKMPLGEVLRD